ncbi:MAG: hypothetical protein ACPLZC_02925 [Candidatus Bathyarchaeales archaeon]
MGKKRFASSEPRIIVDEKHIIRAEKLRLMEESKLHEEEWISEHYIKERLKALGIVE